MRREKNKDGDGKRIVYESGDGVRRRYYALLNPDLMSFPRKVKLRRSVDYLLGDGPALRPLFAAHELAVLAEYFLWHSKFGRNCRGRGYMECVRFFAATRRVLRNILASYPVGRRIDRRGTAHVRDLVASVVPLGVSARAALKKKKTEFTS